MIDRNSSSAKNDQLILVNILEEYVGHHVRKTFHELGGCDCEVCYLNACAIALNALEPKYVTTTKGALLSGITATEVGNTATILVEVVKAVMIVMENPRH